MKISEMRDMTIDELRSKASDFSEEICKLKIQHGIRPLENPSVFKNLRMKIAQINTVINEKQH
ncbi:MAG: 50S ribosomal protein L29 [Desulfurivibrionaceae bacterium]|nr:50S ribosomal protein L29 [Desulfurivibrionaceae bacterium]